MSKIPYTFKVPIPSYFDEIDFFNSAGDREYTSRMKFLRWAFDKCRYEEHQVVVRGVVVNLQPFEFVYGRSMCSEESGLTENQQRHQLNLHISMGNLKKTTSKNSNLFTVYKWVTDNFCKTNHQRNHQRNHQQNHQRISRVYMYKDIDKEIYHPQTPSFQVAEKPKKDLIDFFGIRISKKEFEDLKLLASESDLQICINELKANFAGQKILSWHALIKKHLERNKHKFVQKNREKNCQTVNQFYEKNKQKIENKAKIRMSEDKKFAIICCDHRTEEIFLGESPAIFTTQLECCFRKLDLWTSEPEKSFKEVNSIDFNIQNSLFSNFNLSVLSKKQKDEPTYQPNIFNSTQSIYGGFRQNL